MTSQFQEDFGGEVTNAVLATGIDCPLSLSGRMNAMQKLSQSPEFSSMRATFKRVMGLTKEHTSTLIGDEQWVDETEQILCKTYLRISSAVDDHLAAQDFDAALNALGQLKEPVDALFDAVMVMDTDLQVRNNRLSLLKSIANHFRQIADFTILST
jgi:glycyl-tRNA synthetase beta chain